MTLQEQTRGLRIVAAITMAFGLATAIAAYPPLNGATILLVDLLVWPIDGAQTGTDSTVRLMFAIGGGIFTGFGAMWYMAAGPAYAKAPQELRRVLIGSALVWFVTDSTASVMANAASNVIGNIGFLALLLWPLRKPVTTL